MSLSCAVFRSLLLVVAFVLCSTSTYGVWPLPPHRVYPCDPATDPNNCYQCSSFTRDAAYQVRQADRSPRNTAIGPDSSGICNGFTQWCQLTPEINSPGYIIVPGIDGSPRIRFLVPYDFPNNFCQFWDDGHGSSCGWTVWPMRFGQHNLKLDLLLNGNPVLTGPVPAIYENGLWMPSQGTGCDGGISTYTARAINQCNSTVPANIIVTHPSSTSPATAGTCRRGDRRPCLADSRSTAVGKPINIGSGDVSYEEHLFTASQAPGSLSFTVAYHSGLPYYPALVTTPMSEGWTHTFAQTLRPVDPFGALLYHITAEGFESMYETQNDGTWKAIWPGELRGTVTKVGSQYELGDLDSNITRFDVATGRWLSSSDRWNNVISGTYNGSELASITDSMGRVVTLTYSSGRLSQVTADGQAWRFTYTAGSLTQLFDPLHTSTTPWRKFSYVNDSFGVTRLLSEVRDEADAILESHAYDSQDRGLTSVSQGGKESVAVEYDVPSIGQRRVTHQIGASLNQVSEFTLTYHKGRWLPTAVVGNCATCGGGSSDSEGFTYDQNNRVLTRTDGNGHVTSFTYNADGNILSRTEAVGTPKARTTTYAYQYGAWPNFITQTVEPSAAKGGSNRITTAGWNSSGTPETVLTQTVSGYLLSSSSSPAVHMTVSTFDGRHRILSINGPRTDVNDTTTYTYYGDGDANLNRRGRLQQVTDAASLTTSFDNYDFWGTARMLTDPNGVITERITDSRARVTAVISKAVAGDSNEPLDYTASTIFDGRDRMIESILPAGNRVKYRYEDGTNRLTDTIRLNAAGNEAERRHLTLNIIGGVVTEEDQICASPAPTCATWTTRRSQTNVYDNRNRLTEVQYPVPAGAKMVYTYDADGQLETIRDENHTTPNIIHDYDELDRLFRVTQKQINIPGPDVVTTYGYDVHDNLLSVTDPNGNVTTYAYDDFGRMQRQTSPVTGVTVYTYDAAGNLTSTTDANGATTTRTFDALNRPLTSSSVRSGYATEVVNWTYDSVTAGAYRKGRASTMTDPSGSTSYAYERRGLLRNEDRIILNIAHNQSYAYDPNGNRKSMTYPSGRVVNTTFDFAGRPFSASTGGTVWVNSATYQPFGPLSQLAYGNGTTKTMAHDLRYRPLENKLSSGGGTIAEYDYTHDAAGNITAILDATNANYNRTFGYDDLNRLTTANTGSSLWQTGSFAYDAMGNTTSLNLGTARSASFSYAGTTPKLTSVLEGTSRAVSYDAAGNETAVGSAIYSYSPRNLLVSGDGLRYIYDGRGVRVLTVTTAPSANTAPADFDGDGESDVVKYRDGAWLFWDYTTGAELAGHWTGQPTTDCIPAPADYDGDGDWDFSLLCGNVWHFYQSDSTYLKGILTGGTGSDIPAPADYNGDGIDEVVLFRNGTWRAFNFASGAPAWEVFTGPASGGKPVPMDYDGDGAAEFSVHEGGAWHFYKDDGTYLKGIWVGAIAGDIAVPGDYDGNGTEDVAIFRTGAWLFWDFATGASLPGVWTGAASLNGDPVRPTPSDYNGDGKLELSTHAGGPWHFFNADGSYLKGIWTGAVVGDQAISRVQHYTGDVGSGKWGEEEEAGTVRGLAAENIGIHATHASERRRYFYSPELNLVAESELTSAANPGTAYEYIWFGGEPVGQYDALTSTPRWTFTDHLGTPLLLTNANATAHWRAEHEPYGRVFQMRTGDSHQPLRLPGQEAEQLNLGPNGLTERSYNIFRWYRGGWGRYSQADPIGLEAGANLFAYVHGNPLVFTDPLGLKARICCKKIPRLGSFRHCFIDLGDGDGDGRRETWGLHEEQGLGGSFILGGLDSLGAATRGRVIPNQSGFDQPYSPGDETCGGWKGGVCGEVDDCVDRAARAYPQTSIYSNNPVYFRNSNTFAGNVARTCGLERPPLLPRWTTPGWNSTVPRN